MSNKFTERAERALNNAVKLAENLGHTYIGSEHILLSLSEEGNTGAAAILSKHDIDNGKIRNAIKECSGYGVKTNLNPVRAFHNSSATRRHIFWVEICLNSVA